MQSTHTALLVVSLTLAACAVPTPREMLTDAVDMAIMNQADYVYRISEPAERAQTPPLCNDCDERRFAMSHSRLTEAEAAARRDELTSDLIEHMNTPMERISVHSCVPDERRPYELSAALMERFDALLGPVPRE